MFAAKSYNYNYCLYHIRNSTVNKCFVDINFIQMQIINYPVIMIWIEIPRLQW